MRILLYGGTFDPIHHGHLLLAQDAMEALGADEVHFILAAISPHKLERQPTPAALRREMLAAALAGEPRFVLDDQEIHRPGPSYTIDTVEVIHAAHPEAELLYLIGQDNVALLSTWHRFAELEKLVEFVVLRRAGGAPGVPGLLPRRVDISSTEVRERIAQGRSIRYLVPEPVRLLIEQHSLYLP